MRSGQHFSIVIMLKVKVKATKNHTLLQASAIFSAEDRDVRK
jgi:hypothetical protein